MLTDIKLKSLKLREKAYKIADRDGLARWCGHLPL